MDQIIVPDLPLIGVYQPRHATKNIDISEFPKDFCKAPIIAASKQTAGRHVIVKTSRREYQIGGEHPYLPNTFVPALISGTERRYSCSSASGIASRTKER